MIEKSGVLFTFTPSDPDQHPKTVTVSVVLPEETEEVTVEFDATPLQESSDFRLSTSDSPEVMYEGDSIVDTPAHDGELVHPDCQFPTRPTKSADLAPSDPSEPAVLAPEALLTPQFAKTPPQEKQTTRVSKPLWAFPFRRALGTGLLAAALIGLLIPTIPKATFETSYIIEETQRQAIVKQKEVQPMPESVPITFDPLIGPDGKPVTPVNTEFSIVIPKVGINAPVIAGVDALNAKEYSQALQKGVAHAKSSYLPNQDGATYLFSHSTNYQWFVRDLNAIFYNVKNLDAGDLIVVFYKGKRYTYRYVNKVVVPPQDTSYLLPVSGKRMLILQTCWPPGTTQDRLMVFADLIDDNGQSI